VTRGLEEQDEVRQQRFDFAARQMKRLPAPFESERAEEVQIELRGGSRGCARHQQLKS
jgi:hypothetical protein